MTETTSANTWGKAVALWFWTNVGGIVGVLLTLAVFTARDSNSRSGMNGVSFIIGIIGGISTLFSLPVIPLAYLAFSYLLPIRGRASRLLVTAGTIIAVFVTTLLVATASVGESSVTFSSAMGLGGWAYLLAALIAAATVYSPAILRPDDLPLTNDDNTVTY